MLTRKQVRLGEVTAQPQLQTLTPTSTELAQIRAWAANAQVEYFSLHGRKVFDRLAEGIRHIERLFALIDASEQLSQARFLVLEPSGSLRFDLAAYLRTSEGQKLLSGDRSADAILESAGAQPREGI